MKVGEKIREDLIPSAFTAATIFLILFTLRLENNVIITSFAASSYIVFILPKNITSRHRNLVGGHIIGLFSGIIAIVLNLFLDSMGLITISFAIALSTLLMSSLDLHHPPANGTALAVALNGSDTLIFFSIMSSLIIVLFFSIIYRSLFYKN